MSAALKAVAVELGKIESAFDAVRTLNDRRPATTSAAAQDCASDPPSASRWGEQPGRDTYKLAELLLIASFDHLHALEVVLSANRVPTFASSSLCRAVIDMAARALWLLDPSIDAAARMQRGFTERLYSSAEEIKLIRDLKQDPSREQQHLEQIVNEATAAGFTVTSPKRKSPYVGRQRQTSTDLVAALIAVVPTQRVALPMWRVASAMQHGTAYALLKTLTAQMGEDPGVVDAVALPRDDDISLAAMVAAVCLIDVVHVLVTQYGWNANDWISASDEVLRQLVAIVGSTPAGGTGFAPKSHGAPSA